MHGGGWIVGRPETDDISNRNLCRQRNVLIFSIDYRLAPEHPYPVSTQDCEDVLCWVVRQAFTSLYLTYILTGERKWSCF
jgi:acetyl esterase/lipase